MSLPHNWVDSIFDKLTMAYGHDFLRRWQDIDINKVKADWAKELEGYENHPSAIAYALQNLPVDRPPTVFQFRQIAMRAPPKPAPQLPPPKANPELVRAEIAKARAILMRNAA